MRASAWLGLARGNLAAGRLAAARYYGYRLLSSGLFEGEAYAVIGEAYLAARRCRMAEAMLDLALLYGYEAARPRRLEARACVAAAPPLACADVGGAMSSLARCGQPDPN